MNCTCWKKKLQYPNHLSTSLQTWWLCLALLLCMRHKILEFLPWFTVFSKARRISMTNPLWVWMRGCCAFTPGYNENRTHNTSITTLTKPNISRKLLWGLNIPGICQNERSWRKWVIDWLIYFTPHSLSIFSAEPFLHLYLMGQSASRFRVMIICFEGGIHNVRIKAVYLQRETGEEVVSLNHVSISRSHIYQSQLWRCQAKKKSLCSSVW